jgi:seryl-tRNA synthetase
MTENTNTNTESTSSQTENSENMIPQSRFNKVNEERKALAERLEALEKAQAERDESTRKQRETELAEQNQYKQLYESAKAEVESLKALQSEVKRYRESFENTLQSRIQSIPEEKRALIPDYDDPIKTMAWLDKALPELTTPPKPNAPRLDGGSGGAGGTGNPIGNLNPVQRQLIDAANNMGFSVDANRVAQFAKNPTTQTNLDNKGDKP